MTSPQAVGNAFTLSSDRLFVVSSLEGLTLVIHDLNGLRDLNGDLNSDLNHGPDNHNRGLGPASKVVILADRVNWQNVDRTFCKVLKSENSRKCVVALVMKSGEICISVVDVKSGALSQSFRIGECKRSNLNAPGTLNPLPGLGWENSIFPFSAFPSLG